MPLIECKKENGCEDSHGLFWTGAVQETARFIVLELWGRPGSYHIQVVVEIRS